MDRMFNGQEHSGYRSMSLYIDSQLSYIAAQHGNPGSIPDQDGSGAPVSSATRSHAILRSRACGCGELGVKAGQEPLQRRFEVAAWTTPCAVAVSFNGRQLSYGELDEQADALAMQLQAIGLPACSFCMIDLEPSLAQVRAILAVLKAGAACLQFDPGIAPGARDAALAALRPVLRFTRIDEPAVGPAGTVRTICCDEDAADLPYGWPDELPVGARTPAHAHVAVSADGELCISVRTHQAMRAMLGNGAAPGSAAAAGCGPEGLWRPLSHGLVLTIQAPPQPLRIP